MPIRWTQPAARDLTSICDYIAQHGSTASARRVALSICEGVAALAEFPERGRSGRQIRHPRVRPNRLPYLAVYRIRGDVVEILRILHGTQN